MDFEVVYLNAKGEERTNVLPNLTSFAEAEELFAELFPNRLILAINEIDDEAFDPDSDIPDEIDDMRDQGFDDAFALASAGFGTDEDYGGFDSFDSYE